MAENLWSCQQNIKMGNSECCQQVSGPDFNKPMPKQQKSQQKGPTRQNYQPFKEEKTNMSHGKPVIRDRPPEVKEPELTLSLNKDSRKSTMAMEGKANANIPPQQVRPSQPESDKLSERLPASLIEPQPVSQVKPVSMSVPEPQTKTTTTDTVVKKPEVAPAVLTVLREQKFFVLDLPENPKKKQYNGQYYEGQLDNSGKLPKGYGKLIKADGSVYVGHFQAGKADGEGAHVFTDGTYYVGPYKSNVAEGERGRYKGINFEYTGGFKDNLFNGDGIETHPLYTFTGEFKDGHRVEGEMEWVERQQKFRYKGHFNELNQFHGYGELKEPRGKYEGDFVNGRKHGQGKYQYKNGLLFQGEYVNGTRQGHGALYNPGRRLAYQGSFVAGMPHGEGEVLNEDNLRESTRWVHGISSELIEPEQEQ